MEIKGITVRNDLLEEVAGITPEYPFTMHHADMRTTHIPGTGMRKWSFSICDPVQ